MSAIQQQNPDLVGAAPALAQLSDFVYGEAGASYASNPGSLTGAKPDAIKVSVIRQLTKRKIYLWLWADLNGVPATTPFFVNASLKILVNSSVVATLPANIGIASTSFSGATPYSQSPQYVVLQPQYLSGEIDEIRLSIDQIHPNVINIRAWLGIMSSQ